MPPVLQIRDVYPGFRIRNKELSILTQNIVSNLSELWSGLFIPDPDPDFLSIPDPGPGVKNPELRIQAG
jgi:hypothetical protein